MPTTIRQARSTDEINDVLSLRFKLAQARGWRMDSVTEKSGRLVDALDLYPDTVNLVAYRDDVPVGTLRLLSHRAGDPLLDGFYPFDDAVRQLRQPCFVVDWLGILDGTPQPELLIRRMLELGCLLLARKGVAHLVGCLPQGLKPVVASDFGGQILTEKPISTRSGGVLATSIDLAAFYERWVSRIKDREILRFQDLFYITLFDPGEILFVQGERGSTAYVVQDGEVEIVLQKGEQVIPLAAVEQSQLVGEIAMITQEPRTASLVAKSTTTCITLERQGFLGALDREPHLAMDIFRIFSKRITEANRKIAASKPQAPAPAPDGGQS